MHSNGTSSNGRASADRAWYPVRTRPQSEYLAADALERNGHELFFPRVRTPRQRIGQRDSPLFPGYLFVRLDQGGHGPPPIGHVAGVVGWVQFDGVVPTVPDEVMAELGRRLSAMENEGGYWRRYRLGEKVVINSGPMETMAEVLEEPKSPESRVRVLLDFMGQLVTAHVPWQDLQPAREGWTPFYGGRAPRRTRGRGRWIKGFGPRAQGGVPTPRG